MIVLKVLRHYWENPYPYLVMHCKWQQTIDEAVTKQAIFIGSHMNSETVN